MLSFVAKNQAKNQSRPILMFFHHIQQQKSFKRVNPRGFRDELPLSHVFSKSEGAPLKGFLKVWVFATLNDRSGLKAT